MFGSIYTRPLGFNSVLNQLILSCMPSGKANIKIGENLKLRHAVVKFVLIHLFLNCSQGAQKYSSLFNTNLIKFSNALFCILS